MRDAAPADAERAIEAAPEEPESAARTRSPETSDAGPAKVSDARRVMRLFIPYRGTLLVVLILIALAAGTGVVSPFLVREVVDVALPQQRLGLLAWCVGGMIVITAISAALSVVQTQLSTRVGQAIMHDLRVSVFSHLQRMGLAFFTRTRTGEVQSRIFNDIGSMQAVVTSMITSVVSAVAGISMAMIAMIAMDWRLTIFSLISVPLAVWMNRAVGERRKEIKARQQATAADLSSSIQESLSVSGILLGTTMGRTRELTSHFASLSQRFSDLGVASTTAGRWKMAIYTTLMSIIPALTYLLGGLLLFETGTGVTIGTLVAFIALQSGLYPQINSLLKVSTQMRSSMALFARIFEYLDAPVTIREKRDAISLNPRTASGDIELRDVSFRYSSSESDTLSHLDVRIPAGTHTAFVGTTGSGKTTTGYLMARLYDPTEGAVLLDGHDLRDLTLRSIADCIGIVTQETYLLHASIADNLRFANPTASHADLERACRIAQIHDHIASLPEGYQTVVGERGYRFSGGEKQRLALARTILRDPPVLLLDEATSALDTRTEQAMSGALAALSSGRTTISIAHRLSTIRHADQIVVLEKGRVLERGTYDELIQKGGAFAALAARDASV